jgi:hypothetical protein
VKFPFGLSEKSNPSSEETGKTSGLGTFGGVYTPSILTILGVIMYLRFGWVVGNAGLLNTLIIVTLSTAITFLTALSVCAIATDRVVRVGGAYYMISRSLGIETGGRWVFLSTLLKLFLLLFTPSVLLRVLLRLFLISIKSMLL